MKIILIVLVAVVFVGALLFLGYAFLFGERKTDNGNTNTTINQNTNATVQENKNTNTAVTNSNQNTNTTGNTNTTVSGDYNPTEAAARNDLTTLATIYAEFYGSFSNQSDFQNIRTLFDYMTDSLKKQEEKNIQAAGSIKEAEYYSVSTSAISEKVTALDLNKKSATVQVGCQRVEEKGAERTSRRFYQDMTLQYVLKDNAWKVNSAEWGEEK